MSLEEFLIRSLVYGQRSVFVIQLFVKFEDIKLTDFSFEHKCRDDPSHESFGDSFRICLRQPTAVE